jgi:hypothetical protein
MRWVGLIKDKTKKNIKKACMYMCIIMITSQVTVSLIHRSRYRFDDNSNNNYCCVEMSEDCERFFESIGIHTTVVSGEEYNYNNMIHTKLKKASGVVKIISKPDVLGAHQWIVLHIGPFSIPYECTLLWPLDARGRGYEVTEETEGNYKDGKPIVKTEYIYEKG